MLETQFYFEKANDFATQSTCLRRKVGAVIVDDEGRIVGGGCNLSVRGKGCKSCYRLDNRIPSGQRLDLCYATHAEVMAIYTALKNGINLTGKTLFVTTFPCSNCAKLIRMVGISTIYYQNDYNDAMSHEILKSIKTVKVDD